MADRHLTNRVFIDIHDSIVAEYNKHFYPQNDMMALIKSREPNFDMDSLFYSNIFWQVYEDMLLIVMWVGDLHIRNSGSPFSVLFDNLAAPIIRKMKQHEYQEILEEARTNK